MPQDPHNQLIGPYNQTGGARDRKMKDESRMLLTDPATTEEGMHDRRTQLSPLRLQKLNDQGDKERELQRQNRTDYLGASHRVRDNHTIKEHTEPHRGQQEPLGADRRTSEQPENFTESNASYTGKARHDVDRPGHAQTVQTVYTAQTLQSINTKKQSAYLQNQGHFRCRPENLTVQTIYNVDTPEKAYNIHFNDDVSECLKREQESGYGGTVAASAAEFDNVSSLKQNIKRMQMSESRKSMQSGADSRLSRRSQRPLKLINKKVIGNDSFVITVGGNEADFAESEKRQGRLMRAPPDFNPKPSQAHSAVAWPQ